MRSQIGQPGCGSRYSLIDVLKALETAATMVVKLGPIVWPLYKRLEDEMSRRMKEAPPSLEEIERGLVTAAKLVDRYGDAYLPYFLYLEKELAQARAEEGTRLRVKAVIKNANHDK